jgi:hypothetical protein
MAKLILYDPTRLHNHRHKAALTRQLLDLLERISFDHDEVSSAPTDTLPICPSKRNSFAVNCTPFRPDTGHSRKAQA